ncbi:nicotinate phosphoribosyltransferase [Vibrio ostreicida]|uniref:Nicotinate phosphoribosyltransferase n=1 Tax=Vibrio ostreicida TaxID=526588 RepID=A0ABT8BYV6_9VIBR|nr:nicotinate phosphoribosyltransferase [Vibrio ostreicida]MDN3611287.1 nicotinate phosphoribosyltransferase [Vibrio ostreicida]NPD09231.1 nicotinate phosphoribosyltransferase [Vibrio ostreicida]
MSATLFNERIIQSALDLDVYKINMMHAAYTFYPHTQVRYELIVRSDEDLSDLKQDVEHEIAQLEACRFTQDDIHYLAQHAAYLDHGFLAYLADFRFRPAQQVTVEVVGKRGEAQLRVSIAGIWHQTILYETLVMSIISEVRSRRRWSEIPYHQFCEVLASKVASLKDQIRRRGIRHFQFSEMGSRRRFSAKVQQDVVDYFRQHAPELMTGTSNYHWAKHFNLTPIGTVAHEWFMAHQQLVEPAESQHVALDRWQQAFGGRLGIALTDTIGIDAFLKDFTLERAAAYAGVRHDSGDPFEWGDKMIEHYQALGIEPTSKMLIFTDGLNFDRALAISEYFAGRATISFGIGTFLANDMGRWANPSGDYSPLSMVVKMVECNGAAVAKISDEPEKAMCEDPLFLRELKQHFGLRLDQAS